MKRTVPIRAGRAVALTAVALLFASCSGPAVVVMKNPTTGELHECKGGGFSYVQDTWLAKECADAYEKQGWVRTN